jgi:hypothetical protein
MSRSEHRRLHEELGEEHDALHDDLDEQHHDYHHDDGAFDQRTAVIGGA